MASNYSLLDFRTDLAIQLTELDDADENLEGELDFRGKSFDEVLSGTLSRRAEQIEREQGGDVVPQGGGEGGGITAWYLRKQ